jgi:hypothetical protein
MSKYVRRTGEGYESVHSVRNSSISIPLSMIDIDWTAGQLVFATVAEDGVSLTATEPEQYIAWMEVADSPVPRLDAPMHVCDALGVDPGDDVRVYQREGDGLLLVDADDDPRVGGNDA